MAQTVMMKCGCGAMIDAPWGAATILDNWMKEHKHLHTPTEPPSSPPSAPTAGTPKEPSVSSPENPTGTRTP